MLFALALITEARVPTGTTTVSVSDCPGANVKRLLCGTPLTTTVLVNCALTTPVLTYVTTAVPVLPATIFEGKASVVLMLGNNAIMLALLMLLSKLPSVIEVVPTLATTLASLPLIITVCVPVIL